MEVAGLVQRQGGRWFDQRVLGGACWVRSVEEADPRAGRTRRDEHAGVILELLGEITGIDARSASGVVERSPGVQRADGLLPGHELVLITFGLSARWCCRCH